MTVPVSVEETRYATVSIIFIERNEIIPIPMRVLSPLMSYALAGPASDFSRKIRDDVMEAVRDAIMGRFDALYPEKK